MGRASGRTCKKRIKLPDGNVRRYVRHGAVRAKLTFTRARERIDTDAPKWFEAEIDKLVEKESGVMAEPIKLTVSAQDDASKTLDEVKAKGDALNKMTRSLLRR